MPMGDDTSWIEKRKSLKVLKSHGVQSSSLKRKLSIVNKLRNIASENFGALLGELSDENMNRFHSEIVNSLLANTRAGIGEIHRIVEVVYLYSFDTCFTTYLVASLRRQYLGSWVSSCIFLEVFYLLRKRELEATARLILKNLKDSKVSYVYYVLTSFEIDCEIFREFVAKEIDNANERDIEKLQKIAKIMHISHEISPRSDFVDLVKIVDHEFDFYGVAEPGPSPFFHEQFTPQTLKTIEQRMLDISFLDFVGQNIQDKPYLVEKLWKKRRNVNLIPSLGRIFSKAVKSCSGMVASLFSRPEMLRHEDLVLVSELYKFDVVKTPELFDMLEFYLSRRMIEKLCVVLETTGRFLLANKHTNRQTVELMERLKSLNCMNVEKIHISNCLSRILSPRMSRMTILDFLRWFFSTSQPKDGLLLAKMRMSRKFMLAVFLQPSLFGETRLLAETIEHVRMSEFLKCFYLNVIPKICNSTLLFQIVEVLGFLARNAVEQEELINGFRCMDIDDESRSKSILLLLDMMGQGHHSAVEEVASWAKRSKNREVEVLLFNFREKYKCPCEDSTDSFEREIACMGEDDF